MKARFHQMARSTGVVRYGGVLISLVVLLVLLSLVYSGKEVNLVVGGKTEIVRTRAQTVSAVLSENGVKIKAFDEVTPKLSTQIKEGMTIDVKHAVPVVIKLNDQVIERMSTASTVKELLSDIGLQLNKADKVQPSKDEKIKAGMTVKITQVTSKFEVTKVPVSYRKITKYDSNLDYGKKKIITKGKPGVRLKVTEIVYEGNRPVSSKVKLQGIVSPPIAEVVAVGTKRKLAQLARPAVAVSRGEERDPSGKVLTMVATAYTPNYGPGVGSITSTGIRAKRGVVAVDPRVIPLGTRVYVDGYGEAIAADTGSAIKGYRIDLCFDTVAESIKFGRRTVKVTILD